MTEMRFNKNTFKNMIATSPYNVIKDKADRTQESVCQETLYEWLISTGIILQNTPSKEVYNILCQDKVKQNFKNSIHNSSMSLQLIKGNTIFDKNEIICLLSENDYDILSNISDGINRDDLKNIAHKDDIKYFETLVIYLSVLYYPHNMVPDELSPFLKRIISGITIDENNNIRFQVFPNDIFMLYNIFKTNETNLYVNMKYDTSSINSIHCFFEAMYNAILMQTKSWTQYNDM